MVSRKSVQHLMRTAGLLGVVARTPYGTTIRMPGVRVADGRVERRFRPDGPRRSSRSPTSPYLRTWEGSVDLATVQDTSGRRIDHSWSDLVVNDLEMAPHSRRPTPGPVHHCFVSRAFGQKASDAGISVSMGSKGRAYDNDVVESLFRNPEERARSLPLVADALRGE